MSESFSSAPPAGPVSPAYSDALSPTHLEETPRPARVPHLGHTAVFFLIALAALVSVQTSLYALAVYRHIFPGDSLQQLQHEPLLIVPSEALAYVLALGASALIFRTWWKRSFSTGIEPQQVAELPRGTGRGQPGSPDDALGTLDPAPLDATGGRHR